MSNKWVENCKPDDFVGPFALQVLHERMEVVEAYLSLTATHGDEDTEFVHQLRVGCRRAMAALRAFQPLFKFPPKKLQKWLKRIREAAGPARDLDVLLERFSRAQQDEVTDYALERLKQDRRAAQSHIKKVAKKALPSKFNSVADCAIMLVFSEPYPSTKEYGSKAVQAAFYPFAQLADHSSPSPHELHQLRIAGKRLRYSLEIFHGIFPEDLRQEIYPQIEQLQERLGAINDHATAQALFQSWLGEMTADGLAAALAARIVVERESLLEKRSDFLEWWSVDRQNLIADYFRQHLNL